MVDLGKYALTVLSAYAVTLGLLAALVGVTLVQSRRMRRALEAVEGKGRGNGQT